MRGILADVNCEGHAERLVRRLRDESRLEFWEILGLESFEFPDFGLERSAVDREVWLLCQREQLALLTVNRNADDEDALQVVITELNDETCLPVFTISNPRRLASDRLYAGTVADRFLDYLFEIEKYLGTGRLFI